MCGICTVYRVWNLHLGKKTRFPNLFHFRSSKPSALSLWKWLFFLFTGSSSWQKSRTMLIITFKYLDLYSTVWICCFKIYFKKYYWEVLFGKQGLRNKLQKQFWHDACMRRTFLKVNKFNNFSAQPNREKKNYCQIKSNKKNFIRRHEYFTHIVTIIEHFF